MKVTISLSKLRQGWYACLNTLYVAGVLYSVDDVIVSVPTLTVAMRVKGAIRKLLGDCV